MITTQNLTAKEQKVLDSLIIWFNDETHHQAPNLRELGVLNGFSRTMSLYYAKQLKKKRVITYKKYRPRSIKLIK